MANIGCDAWVFVAVNYCIVLITCVFFLYSRSQRVVFFCLFAGQKENIGTPTHIQRILSQAQYNEQNGNKMKINHPSSVSKWIESNVLRYLQNILLHLLYLKYLKHLWTNRMDTTEFHCKWTKTVRPHHNR